MVDKVTQGLLLLVAIVLAIGFSAIYLKLSVTPEILVEPQISIPPAQVSIAPPPAVVVPAPVVNVRPEITIEPIGTELVREIAVAKAEIKTLKQEIAALNDKVEQQMWLPVPIVSPYLANDSVHASIITTGAVTTTEILDATIVTGDIAQNTITGGNILNSTIETGDIATGGVTGSDIFNGTVEDGDLAPYTKAVYLDIYSAINETLGLAIINGSGAHCPIINTTNTTNIAWINAETCWIQYRWQIPDDYSSGLRLNISYTLGQLPAADTYLAWDIQVYTNSLNANWNGTAGGYTQVNMTNTTAGQVNFVEIPISETFGHGEIFTFDITAVKGLGGMVVGTTPHLIALKMEYRSSGLNQGGL